MAEPTDGRSAIERPGFSYLPRFIEKDEAEALIAEFAARTPIWERRFSGDDHGRSAGHCRRLTRPVYWLGAWQFAALGYYAEPSYREDRCLRAEPLSPTMTKILERLQPMVAAQHAATEAAPNTGIPNTCLINYYGSETQPGKPPRDYARIRMHRDGEPGPVIMFSIGQSALLEFLDPERDPDPELAVWVRHRSVCVLSGADFKDRLYHRITQVRTGAQPQLTTSLECFRLRRVSVSFRHVPESLIQDFHEFSPEPREQIRAYVQDLAENSDHYQQQLKAPGPSAGDARP